jgi:hypothetical protein
MFTLSDPPRRASYVISAELKKQIASAEQSDLSMIG